MGLGIGRDLQFSNQGLGELLHHIKVERWVWQVAVISCVMNCVSILRFRDSEWIRKEKHQ